MKTIPYILLIFLALGQSCSPQRRLTRLLEHNPELTVADTVRLRDTVISPMVKSDTFISLSRMSDTVVVEKDRLLVKLFRHHDTLYVEGKCKADTIVRVLRIPVEKIKLVKAEPETDFLFILFLVLAVVAIIAIIWKKIF